MEMEPAKQCSGAHLIKKGGARPSYLGWLDVAGMLRYVLFFKLQNLTFVMFFYAKTSLFAIFLKTYLRRIKVPNHTSVWQLASVSWLYQSLQHLLANFQRQTVQSAERSPSEGTWWAGYINRSLGSLIFPKSSFFSVWFIILQLCL